MSAAYLARLDSAYAAKARADTAQAERLFRAALVEDSSAAVPRIELAYIDLAAGRRASAARWLEEAVARAPERGDVRRQLGYTLAAIGRTREAIAAFEGLPAAGHPLEQRDQLALGYLHAAVGERQRSAAAFAAATVGDDSLSRGEARRNLSRSAAPGLRLYAEWYLAPFYQTRFENTIGFGFLRAGLVGGATWSPTLYASARLTRDSRSVGGLQPQIFTDNAAIPAIGARVRPFGGPVWTYAEAGAARLLLDDGGATWRRDLRAGAYTAVLHEARLGTAEPVRLLTDVAADVSWYERFDRNTIGYLQLREGLRFRRTGAGGTARRGPVLDLFARGWVGYDGNGDFFNRALEGGGGAALRAGNGVSVFVEFAEGRFLVAPPAGQRPRYADWRFTVVVGGQRSRPVGGTGR